MRRMLSFINLLVVAALALCACATGTSNKEAAPPPSIAQQSDPFAAIPRVSVDELSKALKEGRAVVVDVRHAESFEEEHIAGAYSIPEHEVRERAGELPPDKLVVTYCAWPAEHSSARAASYLKHKGVKDTAALTGGLDAWKAAKLPLEKGKPRR